MIQSSISTAAISKVPGDVLPFCFCFAALILVTCVAYQEFAIPKNVRMSFYIVTLSNHQYYRLRCTSLILAYLLY